MLRVYRIPTLKTVLATPTLNRACGVAIGAAFLTAYPALADQRFELKGMHLGMGQDEIIKKFPALECRAIGDVYTTCSYSPTDESSSDLDSLAEEPTKSWQLYFGKDKLLGAVIVTFPPKSSKQIVPAISKKYGKPTTSKSRDLQTNLGAHFSCANLAWARGDDRFEYAQCADSIFVSRLSLISVKFAKESEKAGEEGIARRAKDL